MEKSNYINYEELYPTVDDRTEVANYGATYPQATPVEHGNMGASYPEVVPVTEHRDADSRYPMAVQKPTLYNTPPPLPGTPITGSENTPIQTPTSLIKPESAEDTPLPPRPGRILGLRKRTFWIICAIILVLIIAGAVGGGVAGLKTSKKSSNLSTSAGGNSNPSSTTSTSPSATALGVATATLSGSIPTGSAINIYGIAASVTTKDNTNYTSIAYQNSSSWEMLYRFNSGSGGFSDAKIMSLPLTPIEKSPLAMTSNTEESGIALNVFYIDNLQQIANVNISCPSATSYDCVIRNVTQISTDFSTSISSKTSLAAEYLGSALGWRVFYQDDNNMLSVTSSISGETSWAPWNNGSIIGKEILAGSAIASTFEDVSGNMTVFYIEDGGGIQMVEWNGGNEEWLEATNFAAKTTPNFSSSGALAAVSQTGTDVESRLYYLGNNSEIYEYTPTATSTRTTTPDQSPQWALADSDNGRIAAVGWDDQVRIYYQSGGEVVESALEGSGWLSAQGV